MSAATAAINTSERTGQIVEKLPLAAAIKIFVGTLVAVNAAGNAVPAADAAGLRVVGRCEGTVGPGVTGQDADNSAGAAGDVSCNAKRGAFPYNNSTAAPIVQADIGKMVFVEDDNTVRKTGGTNSIKAGIFLGFEDGDVTRCIIDTRPAITG